MSRAIARRRRNGISGLNKARINPLNRRPLPAVLGAMSGASGAMMNTTPTILQGLVQVGIGALILNSFDERGIFSSFFGVSGVVGGTLTTVQAIGRGTGMMQGSKSAKGGGNPLVAHAWSTESAASPRLWRASGGSDADRAYAEREAAYWTEQRRQQSDLDLLHGKTMRWVPGWVGGAGGKWQPADRSGDSRGASARGFSPAGETAEQAYRRRMKQAVSRY